MFLKLKPLFPVRFVMDFLDLRHFLWDTMMFFIVEFFSMMVFKSVFGQFTVVYYDIIIYTVDSFTALYKKRYIAT